MGGGILLYFRSTHDCRRRLDLELDGIESIWAELYLPNPIDGIGKCFLSVLYHPPSQKPKALSDHLSDALHTVNRISGLPLVLIGGDFNRAKLLPLSVLSPLVTSATRGQAVLDQVYASHKHLFPDVEVVTLIGSTDHSTLIVKAAHPSTDNIVRSQHKISSRKRTAASLCSLQ